MSFLGYIATTNTILSRYENNKITDITLVRTPLGNVILSFLKTVGGEKFKKELEKLPYDKLFHLRMIVTLDNGKKLTIEKLDNISISTKSTIETTAETLKVNKPLGMTLKELMENTKKQMGSKYFPYQGFTNNCQDFITNILSSNGLNTKETADFVKQDVKTLFRDNPFLRKLVNTITDVSSVVSRIEARKQNRINRILQPVQTVKEIVKKPQILFEFI